MNTYQSRWEKRVAEWRRRDAQKRSTNRYRRKSHHHKKPELDTDWRDKKGFQRDRKKMLGRWPYGQFSKRSYKKISNASHRAMEREFMAREAWDDFAGMDLTKLSHNPWDIW